MFVEATVPGPPGLGSLVAQLVPEVLADQRMGVQRGRVLRVLVGQQAGLAEVVECPFPVPSGEAGQRLRQAGDGGALQRLYQFAGGGAVEQAGDA